MSSIGIFCPPLPGHLHPAAVLGRALIARGHRVTVFQSGEFSKQVESEGLEFCKLGKDVSLSRRIAEMGHAKGLRSLRIAIKGARQSAETVCLHAPDALRKHGIDLILADQNEPAGGTVAEHLGIPFLNICPSLPLNREPAIPPPFAGWAYSKSPWAILRNALGLRAADLLIAPINRTLNRYRAAWNLPPIKTPGDSFSKLGQLSQMTREFDFPRERLPDSFHYLGPWLDAVPRSAPDFPFANLDGRPMVYASFGTLQPNAAVFFRQIAEACYRMGLQLVLAAGAAAGTFSDLPGNPIVVPYAPQLALLPKARLVVTHAGLNTVMQALSFGKPMLAIPQTHDQPAIAARVLRSGAGIVLAPQGCSADAIFNSLKALAVDDGYARAALLLSESIGRAGGVDRGVTIIEQCLFGPRGNPTFVWDSTKKTKINLLWN